MNKVVSIGGSTLVNQCGMINVEDQHCIQSSLELYWVSSFILKFLVFSIKFLTKYSCMFSVHIMQLEITNAANVINLVITFLHNLPLMTWILVTSSACYVFLFGQPMDLILSHSWYMWEYLLVYLSTPLFNLDKYWRYLILASVWADLTPHFHTDTNA